MTDLAQKQAPQRRGFSLVLSLTIMAMILLMVITLASFLSIEARLASANQLRTQARMQALVSLRLALAHLQQEAGPDRRATFRADMMRFAYSSDTANPVAWDKVRNPMWTGVQRTDRPFQLPAWIISGRGDSTAGTNNSQMVSLALPTTPLPTSVPSTSTPYWSSTNAISYPTNYWIPWETGYTGGLNANKIFLVGDATATIFENEGTDPLSGRPDGRVSLPPVALPDTNVSGRYCYWVGDEGVKANISLIDPRVQTSTATNASLSAARRGVSRTGVELLTGLTNYQVGDIDSRIRSTDQLKLLSSTVFSNGSSNNNTQILWPDVTLVSQGLFTDNKWGGLQIDLSTAFAKNDTDFDNSEFGQGSGSVEGTNGAVTYGFMEGTSGPSITNPVSYFIDWVAFRNWKKPIVFNGKTINVAPVWTVKNPWDNMGFSSSTAAIRGPTWYALRNYHQLYQELSSGPQLTARTHFPNSAAFAVSSASYPSVIGFLHYSQMYNRSVTPRILTTKYKATDTPPVAFSTNTGSVGNNFLDYTGYDRVYVYGPRGNSYNNTIVNNSSAGSYFGPIPTRVSVAPYISRQILAIGVIKIGNELQLTISPLTVLHNPYNVRLSVNQQRISIRDLDNWWIEYKRSYATGFTDPYTGSTSDVWRNNEGILSVIKKNNPNVTKFQSLRFDIPSMTMEPGEFKIFSANNLSTSYSSTLTNAFNTNTGFYGPCLDNTKSAAIPPATGFNSTPQKLIINKSDTASLSLKLWTNSYMLEGFKIVHQMNSWPGDSLPSSDATNESFYNTSSIVTELTSSLGRSNYTGLAKEIVGNEPSASIDLNAPINVPDTGFTPYMLGVFDYSIRWANDPSPFTLFVRSNPLAASRRVDARDSTWTHIVSINPITLTETYDSFPPGPYYLGTQYYSSTSPSYKLEVRDLRTINSSLLDTSGGNAYGGMSNWSINGGATSAVFTEVPLTAPLSIAQYTHANFGIYDHEPLFIIGNGFAPAFTKNSASLFYFEGLSSSMNTDPPTSANESSYADPAMMINRALFDRYFLSSIGPVFINGIQTKNQNTVIDDFVDGINPLANPRIKLVARDKELARTELKDTTKNHRKVAKHIINNGAFNIHSMSVKAWASILAGTKAKALSNETGDSSSNARFPRAVRGDNVNASGVNQARYNTQAAWTGLTNLNDTQVSILAREIVKENLWRMSYYHRDAVIGLTGTAFGHNMHGTGTGVTIRDLASGSPNTPPGKLPCPYLGLSQFVNRNLCPHVGGGIRYRCGALQSAIIAADANSAKLSNRKINVAAAEDGLPEIVLNHIGNTYTAPNSLPASPIINSGLYTYPAYLVPPPSVRRGTGLNPTVNGSADQIMLALGSVDPSYKATNYADVKISSPTSLLQSDILAAIGNSLTIRSDTFTIRAYGDVSDKAGSPAAGTCWIEAVVQRIPDFMDSSQDSDTAVNADAVANPNGSGLGHNPNLLPVNINLGRRFVIISMRILKPNEL